jgi:hypothetical protein
MLALDKTTDYLDEKKKMVYIFLVPYPTEKSDLIEDGDLDALLLTHDREHRFLVDHKRWNDPNYVKKTKVLSTILHRTIYRYSIPLKDKAVEFNSLLVESK